MTVNYFAWTSGVELGCDHFELGGGELVEVSQASVFVFYHVGAWVDVGTVFDELLEPF